MGEGASVTASLPVFAASSTAFYVRNALLSQTFNQRLGSDWLGNMSVGFGKADTCKTVKIAMEIISIWVFMILLQVRMLEISRFAHQDWQIIQNRFMHVRDSLNADMGH